MKSLHFSSKHRYFGSEDSSSTDAKQSGNWKDFDLQQTSANTHSFFFKALTIQNLKKLCYADMHLSFKKSQTQSQTKQTKTPSNF